jgi:ribosomal protein L11 methyltransferase
MSWMELSLNTTHEAIDWVSTLLATVDYKGDVQITKYLEPDAVGLIRSANLVQPDLERSPWMFTICLYLPDGYTETAIEKIADRLSPLHRIGQISALQTAVVAEKPIGSDTARLVPRIGKRFVVLADHASDQFLAADEIGLKLKQSLAFGSGLHPTTIVSLCLLERHILPNMSGLDLGSGSGILSVAIAKLGAQVLALDNDKMAVAATQDAIRRNGLEHQVVVMEGSLGRGSELGHWLGGEGVTSVPTINPESRFDFIVANIFARVHIALAADFGRSLRRTAHPGLLITAGFTTDYEDEVNAALTTAGFEAIDCERSNEWVALAHRLKP